MHTYVSCGRSVLTSQTLVWSAVPTWGHQSIGWRASEELFLDWYCPNICLNRWSYLFILIPLKSVAENFKKINAKLLVIVFNDWPHWRFSYKEGISVRVTLGRKGPHVCLSYTHACVQRHTLSEASAHTNPCQLNFSPALTHIYPGVNCEFDPHLLGTS